MNENDAEQTIWEMLARTAAAASGNVHGEEAVALRECPERLQRLLPAARVLSPCAHVVGHWVVLMAKTLATSDFSNPGQATLIRSF